MITFFYRNVREAALTTAEQFRPGTWIHAEVPTEDELARLSSEFGLDADLLNDALDPEEIPRVELDGDNVYVYTRFATRNGAQVATNSLLLVVTPKFVASITRVPLPDLARLTATADLYTTQRPKLLLQLMRYAVASYDRNVTFLTRQIRGVRAKLNVTNVNNRVFIQFVGLEDALNDFLSELGPTNSLLTALLTGRYNLSFFEEDKDLIEDLIQMIRQLTDTCRGSLRTIVNIREAYSNIMSNNLNRQVQLLTTLTIVLTIPTVVFSYFGMNVPLPGQHSMGATALITSGTVAVCALILWMFHKRGWL